MRKLSILFACLLSGLFFATVGAKTGPVTTTLPANVDGITRTVTVVISGTDVLSVTVAPISDTFQVTAVTWLEELYSVYAGVGSNTRISATTMSEIFSNLVSLTDEASYPPYWTPFVRQYRFALYACADFLDVHSQTMAKDEYGLAIGVYFEMRNACTEQYQDAYVEMERIAHPIPR